MSTVGFDYFFQNVKTAIGMRQFQQNLNIENDFTQIKLFNELYSQFENMLIFNIHHLDYIFLVRISVVVLDQYFFGDTLGSFGKDRDIYTAYRWNMAVNNFFHDIDLPIFQHFFCVGLENLLDSKLQVFVEKQ